MQATRSGLGVVVAMWIVTGCAQGSPADEDEMSGSGGTAASLGNAGQASAPQQPVAGSSGSMMMAGSGGGSAKPPATAPKGTGAPSGNGGSGGSNAAQAGQGGGGAAGSSGGSAGSSGGNMSDAGLPDDPFTLPPDNTTPSDPAMCVDVACFDVFDCYLFGPGFDCNFSACDGLVCS
jgi:hypothetical protein